MDFISLSDLIEELAAESQIKNEAAKYSEVAGILHQALHNAIDSRPCWFDSKETGRPLRSDNAVKEGMTMLVHMAGWQGRDMREALEHVTEVINAEKAGIDPALILRSHDPSGGPYKGADFLRAMEIGFDRPEIFEFLGRLPVIKQTSPPVSLEERLQILRAKNEDEEIIYATLKSEYDLRPGQLAVRLNLYPHLKEYASRRRMTDRAIKNGKKKIAEKTNQSKGHSPCVSAFCPLVDGWKQCVTT